MRPDEDRVAEALRALREASAGAEAPARVEANVVAAFRARPRKHRSVAPWLLAIAAALVLAVFIRVGHAPVPITPPQPPAAVATQRALVPSRDRQGAVANTDPKQRTGTRPRLVAAKQQHKQHLPKKQAPLETWSDFVPVPYAPPLNAQDGGQVLRVRLPGNSLRTFGIPMPADRAFDRLNAEVMVGQDGVVRAIRFPK